MTAALAVLALAGCDPDVRHARQMAAEEARIAQAMAVPADAPADPATQPGTAGPDPALGPPAVPPPDPGPGAPPDTPPDPGPGAPPAPAPAPDAGPRQAAPEPPALAEQRRLCTRRGGTLRPYGTGLLACIRDTRDAGQRCTASSQCEGECLARSGTCAPVTPLFGCHEVLLAPDSRVTHCID